MGLHVVCLLVLFSIRKHSLLQYSEVSHLESLFAHVHLFQLMNETRKLMNYRIAPLDKALISLSSSEMKLKTLQLYWFILSGLRSNVCLYHIYIVGQ